MQSVNIVHNIVLTQFHDGVQKTLLHKMCVYVLKKINIKPRTYNKCVIG